MTAASARPLVHGVRPGSARAWLLACRPATLTAALAPVLVGTAVAFASGARRVGPAIAALVGAMLIQIATNLANDVYDHEKGADTAERKGPVRAAQSGLLTPRALRVGLALTVALAVVPGLYLASVAGYPIVVVGVVSILAGVAYTAGPYPLGYHGLGDVFVFVFFGLVAVTGTAFVELGAIPRLAWPGAVSVGALATAVLVVNNVRDRETDVGAGKRTLAVRFGRAAGVAEYVGLLVLAHLSSFAAIAWLRSPWAVLPLATVPIAARLARTVARATDGPTMNQALARTARLVLVHAALFSIAVVLASR
jgi:1,4-dihydroxy-2-naphthoate octaprenyltransferase